MTDDIGDRLRSVEERVAILVADRDAEIAAIRKYYSPEEFAKKTRWTYAMIAVVLVCAGLFISGVMIFGHPPR